VTLTSAESTDSRRVVEFGPLVVHHDERVLAPRQWTIAQSDWAIELSPTLPAGPVLELCAGAGHIGLVLAHATARPLVQVEDAAHAASMAVENAREAGVDTDVRVADLQDALGANERFVIVLADPPYVPSADVGRFPEDPPPAIDGGPDGLDIARQCVAVAADHLDADGVVLLQLLDEEQAVRLAEALDERLVVTEVRTVSDRGCIALLRRAAPA
jgi:methylase of polypeptide subunit release factors